MRRFIFEGSIQEEEEENPALLVKNSFSVFVSLKDFGFCFSFSALFSYLSDLSLRNVPFCLFHLSYADLNRFFSFPFLG